MAEDDDIIPLAPLDEDEEKHRKAEIAKCLKMQEALLEEQAGQPVPVPLEHRENVTARDMDHHIVNYCMDSYNGQAERLRLHLAKMLVNREMAIQSADDFLNGRVVEKTLKIMLPEELAEYLKELIERLQAM